MDDLSPHLVLPAAAAALTIVIFLYNLYRAAKGPLAHLPGPAYTKYTALVTKYQTAKGNNIYYLEKLHEQYGPIVRVTPTEVSVAELAASKEIHKTAGGYLKTEFYKSFANSPIQTIFNSTDPAIHSRWRRLLGNSMSESTLKSFDPIIQSKIDIFTSQLGKEHAKNGYVDMYKWMHFFATDVIGELSFGESFRMLAQGKDNQYMLDIKNAGKISVMSVSLTGRPARDLPQIPIWPLKEVHGRSARMMDYGNASLDRYEKHMALNPEEPKPMFFNKLMGGKGQAASLTRAEINAQAQGFIIAGTDTTANTGTYLMWKVCQNPAVKAKLLKEIAHLPENPTNDELRVIPYLDLLIEETLRLYGAAPGPLPRRVPQGGRTLGGHYIPEGLTVSPVAHVLHRDPNIFPNPNQWIPERWENPTKEMKDAFTAFGGGSRICIGLHLAKMELRAAVVAFFKQFPHATVAYGDDGFCEDDMHQKEFFLIHPRGRRCLLK